MLEISGEEAEALQRSIERSRLAMENIAGIDLEAIVAETAYDYWPQRAALTRARQRIVKHARAAPDAAVSIGIEERAALVTAIGRTQEALQGNAVDLAAIAEEGSREYWERRRAETRGVPVPEYGNTHLVEMTQIFRAAEAALATREERRRPWRDVVYDAIAVAAPLLLIPPLLVSVAEGGFMRFAVMRPSGFQAFADVKFSGAAAVLLLAGAGTLWRAYVNPENRRRVFQFGGALATSAVMAVIAAASIYSNKTNSRLGQMQATLGSRLLVALEQSADTGRIVIPDQIDRSMTVEATMLSPSSALLWAHDQGADGKIRVQLRPYTANYSWVIDGREIPKGELTIANVVAYDAKSNSITLKQGNDVRKYSALMGNLNLAVGSRVAAEIGTHNTIDGIVVLPPSRTQM